MIVKALEIRNTHYIHPVYNSLLSSLSSEKPLTEVSALPLIAAPAMNGKH